MPLAPAPSPAKFATGMRFSPGIQPLETRYAEVSKPGPVPISNAYLANAYTNLYFTLERGEPRKGLSRWIQPVGIVLDWPHSSLYRPFARKFLRKLAAAAQIEVRLLTERAKTTLATSILNVRVAPTAAMQSLLGSSFCIATPGNMTWTEFASAYAKGDHKSWRDVIHVRSATIFIPDSARPYLVRACLMEEIMQALGPAGDFFHLPYSIFNDDNVHHYPTPFDFLALRVLYSEKLTAGLDRAETEIAARAALTVINPAGNGLPDAQPPAVDAGWRDKLKIARYMLHPSFAHDYYTEALEISSRLGPGDPRHLFTLLELGRNQARYSPGDAGRTFLRVVSGYDKAFGAASLQSALARIEYAHTLLWAKQYPAAEAIAAATRPIFISNGRDDKIVETYLISGAAKLHKRQAAQTIDLGAQGRAWRDYALGRRKNQAVGPGPKPGTTWLGAPPLAVLLIVACLAFLGAIMRLTH